MLELQSAGVVGGWLWLGLFSPHQLTIHWSGTSVKAIVDAGRVCVRSIQGRYAAKTLKSVYDILDELRARPALYLGNLYARNQLGSLQAFLTGLSFANLEDGEPSFWDFNRWVTGYVEGMSHSLPWDWLDNLRGHEQSFQDFFNYLDIYRRCRIVEAATPTTTDLKPTFYHLDSDHCRMEPPIPDSIHIGQFAPSEVFFLGERYGDRLEMEFPYYSTLSEAIAHAQHRWQVSTDGWQAA